MMNIFDTISHHWVLAIVLSLALYIIGSAVYNLYFSPLSKYPGPFLARISGIPNFYHSITGFRHIWIWQCHQIYGDEFRYQPNGLLFNSPTAFRQIHETKANTKKALFYQIYPRNIHNWNTLTVLSKAEHTRKRRVLNSAFSDRAMRSSEAFVIKNVDRWADLRIRNNIDKKWSKPENMSDLSSQLTFDVMGELSFGKSLGIKEPDENPLKSMPHVIEDFVKASYILGHSPFLPVWVWLKPRGLDALVEFILPPTIRKFYDFLETNVEHRRQEEEALENKGIEQNKRKEDLFHYIFQTKDESGRPAYSNEELLAEANLLVVAGSDTTATALSSFWFYIVRREICYQKLVDEIQTTFTSLDAIHGGPELSSCKYLCACINEALRICPIGPSEAPREVLPGGLSINGSFIPAGVQVGVPVWTLNHNESIYGDPFTFRPERWIEDPKAGVTAEDVSRVQSAAFPFHLGAGNCAGKGLALLEMQLTIARTLWRMDVRLFPGDRTGAGSKDLPWGMRREENYQVRCAFVSLRDGPVVQFRPRV